MRWVGRRIAGFDYRSNPVPTKLAAENALVAFELALKLNGDSVDTWLDAALCLERAENWVRLLEVVLAAWERARTLPKAVSADE